MAFISFQRISIIKTKLLLLDLQVRWGRKREKKEKEAKETKEGGGQMHHQKKKKLSSHGSILYIYKVTYFVYSKQNILITKKKKSLINILMFEFKTFLYPSPNKSIPITQNDSNK
jgi:hypothetical protein